VATDTLPGAAADDLWSPASLRTPLGVLAGVVVSVLLISIVATLDAAVVRPRLEAAQRAAHERDLEAMQVAGLPPQSYWVALRWRQPSARRRAGVLAELSLPVGAGATVAGRLVRRRPWLAGAWVASAYALLVMLPMSGISTGDRPVYPLRELEYMRGDMLLLAALGLFVALPLAAARLASRAGS
jgi:hypothetical protein